MPDPHPALTPPLTFEQARVLGCLLEKEALVPDSYPLTLNTLITACNQSTNRDPVTHFDETTVVRALDGLRESQWAFQLSQAGARVPKFKHNLSAKIPGLSPASVALLCTLITRGHQTAGELRQRCERMHAFPDLPSLEAELDTLQTHPDGPLIVCLPAGSGRRVPAYAHLFCGPVDPALPAAAVVVAPSPPSTPPVDPEWKDRIEAELVSLRAELTDLKTQLGL
jgi:uncharacterized protein YceH (UPF0502 family)